MHHIVTPGFVDSPCRGACTAGQISWLVDHKWEHRTPPLARIMGVGRQQQQDTRVYTNITQIENYDSLQTDLNYIYLWDSINLKKIFVNKQLNCTDVYFSRVEMYYRYKKQGIFLIVFL